MRGNSLLFVPHFSLELCKALIMLDFWHISRLGFLVSGLRRVLKQCLHVVIDGFFALIACVSWQRNLSLGSSGCRNGLHRRDSIWDDICWSAVKNCFTDPQYSNMTSHPSLLSHLCSRLCHAPILECAPIPWWSIQMRCSQNASLTQFV